MQLIEYDYTDDNCEWNEEDLRELAFEYAR